MSEHVYDPTVVEKKWQALWQEQGTNQIDLAKAENPFYVLMMFPYPSAEGLHVGNVYAFTGADVQGRHRRLRGYDVFEPIGFDAFGIHSENFAMKINRHPSDLIPANVANFTRQLNMMGFMFDWRHSVDTTSPEYYKWTQWIFLQLYKNGLAYRDEKEVNFCPDCGTVIADEQVNPDGTCERHGDTKVQRRNLPCWFFRITDFAETLAKNQEWLDWSDTTKTAQLNWIGRSEGAEVDFVVEGADEKIRVYTTRPDTLFGATFMVLAPDHPLVDKIADPVKKSAIEEYRRQIEEGVTGVPPVESPAIKKRHGANLPHWTAEGKTYSVNFRLSDSMPQDVLDFWRRERDDLKHCAESENRTLSEEEEKRLQHLFSDKVEKYLDAGYGSCAMKQDQIAKIVSDALQHFDGDRYHLYAWCVMPNHVHALLKPIDGNELPDIMHSWKSFTSHEIKKLIGDRWPGWLEEYFDHMIRNEASFDRAVSYILENPEKAGLTGWRWMGAAEPHGRDARDTFSKEKTGINIGAKAINPLTGKSIPIFIADYVMMGYGTGAIMAVPSGDHRDFEFARKFDLPVISILDPEVDGASLDDVSGLENADALLKTPEGRAEIRAAVRAGNAAWSGSGKTINSANEELDINGLDWRDAKKKTTEYLEKKGLGVYKTTYRLRDWGISRQRYWGPPIPILYDEEGNMHPVPEDQLPVMLPPIDDFRPKGDGRGPLATVDDWVNVEIDGKKYRRESDVMDNFLDSAWYFLRYISARDDKQPYDPELIKKWLPVDIYIGGNEHAVLHLLYTRFICQALTKCGVLDMKETPELKDKGEPFRKFRAHGLLIKEGSKMSKSKGNVVNPDEYVERWGADTLRLYLMFLGPYQQGGDFRDDDIVGMRRFLNRLHAWYFEQSQPIVPDEDLPKDLRVKTHQTIKKVREDIDHLYYNTAISATMELFNAAKGAAETSEFVRETILTCIAPFAPHFAEEVWKEALKKEGSFWDEARIPEFDEALTKLDEVEIVLQFKGKVRDKVKVPREATVEELETIALQSEKIQKALGGNTPRKIIAVPGRLVNVIA